MYRSPSMEPVDRDRRIARRVLQSTDQTNIKLNWMLKLSLAASQSNFNGLRYLLGFWRENFEAVRNAGKLLWNKALGTAVKRRISRFLIDCHSPRK